MSEREQMDHDDPRQAAFDPANGQATVEEALTRICTGKQERPSADFYPIFKLPTLKEANRNVGSSYQEILRDMAFSLARQCAFHDDGAAFAVAAQSRLGAPKSFLIKVAANLGGDMPEKLVIFKGALRLSNAQMGEFAGVARARFCSTSERMIAMLSAVREAELWAPKGPNAYKALIEELSQRPGMERAISWAQAQAEAAELERAADAPPAKPGRSPSL